MYLVKMQNFFFGIPVINLILVSSNDMKVRRNYVSRTLKIVYFLLFLHTCLPQSQGTTDDQKPVSFYYFPGVRNEIYSQIGDINIGDIATVFKFYATDRCKEEIVNRGAAAENTESTKFAVDWVNKNPNILPNVTLGFIITGSCNLLSMNLASSTFYLPRTNRVCNESNCYTQLMSLDNQYVTHDVISILAPMFSTKAAALSSLFGTAHLPILGYVAGSYELRDTRFHPYFFRVNTEDYYQVRGILKFISDKGWSYIQFVYKDDYYGREARKFMNDLAGRYGICIAASHMVEDFKVTAKALLRNPLARVVVLFFRAWRLEYLLRELLLLNATGHFIWVGSARTAEYRGYKYKGTNTDPAIGAFTIHPYTTLIKEYYDRMEAVDILKTKNPWLKSVWEKLLKCSFAENSCPKDAKILKTREYTPLKSASLRIDAVLAIAHAAHNLLQDRCPGATGKEARACITGESLREYLMKVKFEGFNGPVEFDEHQDVRGKFTISQLNYGFVENRFSTNETGSMYAITIAHYDSVSDDITYMDHPISWSHLDPVERLVPVSNDSLVKDVPESVCSRPCVVGEYKIERELPCCWDCLKCRENERLINENTGCEACPLFEWPDPVSNFTTCVDIPLTYQTVKDPIPIALVSMAVIALTLTISICCAYFKYRNERVIKASSKELSFIQQVGISCGYITVILFQTTPTDTVCQCIFFTFCMSFTMLYSPLLVKTVRIFRIFRSASENKKPKFVGQQSQLIISFFLIIIQFVLCGAVYFLYFPGARRTQPIWSEKFVELSCDFTIPGLSSFLGYNILLVSLCSVFAFMVRKLPDNYNESRFITMCVSTTLLIWMAFIPTYFTADREYMRMFLLCMALLLNHSVALILLFFPRIYAAAFMSDESLNFAIKK